MYHGILIPGSQTDIQDLLAITAGHRCQLDGENTARTAMYLCGIAAIACEPENLTHYPRQQLTLLRLCTVPIRMGKNRQELEQMTGKQDRLAIWLRISRQSIVPRKVREKIRLKNTVI